MSEASSELRRIALIRGATTATEARDILAQSAQVRLDALDAQVRSLLAEGHLTGEAAIAHCAERNALLRLFAELDGMIDRGRRAIAGSMKNPGG